MFQTYSHDRTGKHNSTLSENTRNVEVLFSFIITVPSLQQRRKFNSQPISKPTCLQRTLMSVHS